YAEDLLWAKHALEAGFSLVHDPRAGVVHGHSRGFNYEFRRALLDAWVMDQAFGYRYAWRDKLNRVQRLGTQPAGIQQRVRAFNVYLSHFLARSFYNTLRFVGGPSERFMSRMTDG